MSEVSEAGIITDPGLVPIPEITDDDILRMGDSKTLKQLKEQGAFLSKQLDKQIKGSEDKEKDLFILAIFYLNSRKTEEETFEKLAGRNAKLAECDQFTFEELQDIRDHAARYIAIMQQVKRDDVQQEAKEEIINQEPDEIDIAADEIIQNCKVMDHFLKTFKTLHSGDEDCAKVMLLSSVCGSSLTSEGIHFHVTGKKGIGKTTAIRAFLKLWPEEYVIAGEFSLKNLYYNPNLKPGAVVWPDDSYANPESESHIKRAMSTFQDPTEYHSVGKGESGTNEGITMKIPPRIVFFGSNTGKPGSDELSDRQYRVTIVQTPESDKAFWEYLKKRIKTGDGAGHVSDDMMICRRILEKFKTHRFKVVVPFADRMVFTSLEIRRDVEMFLSFVDAVTVLNYAKRQQKKGEDTDGEFIILEATEEDFFTACRIFKISENLGGRKYQTSTDEQKLAIWMSEQMAFYPDGILEQDIIKKYGEPRGMNRTTIKRLLTGRDGESGIINQIPGAYQTKVNDMETEAEETQTGWRIVTKRRGRAQNLYVVPLGITAQTSIDDFGFVRLMESG